MAKIVSSIEIGRSPEDVFAYLNDLSRHGEWQQEIISTTVETDGPTRVGTRATDRRRVPGGPQDVTYEITAHDPPRRMSFKGRTVPSGSTEPRRSSPPARVARGSLSSSTSRGMGSAWCSRRLPAAWRGSTCQRTTRG